MKKFKLPESFICQYQSINPKWGFGELGHFVYKRTYSRNKYDENGNSIGKEEWFETVRRVVEGSFTYQKQHCVKLGLRWDSIKAQHSAQTMYNKIFNFKFTPPGRGLWVAGTEFVEKHGSLALNNCGAVSTEMIDIKPTEPFTWAMNALMLGVGCFHPDTKIRTEDGSVKISDITAGDKVLSYNEVTESYEYQPVINVFRNNTKNTKKVEIGFDDGRTVICTEDHLFLTDLGWIQAKDLTSETELISI